MKIYILGVGGVGGYFGGLFAKAGYDVTFVVKGEYYNALIKNGLKIKSVKENFIIKPIKVVNDVSQINKPDLVIFTVKTYDTIEVAKKLAKVVNKNSIILTFQNGIDNDLIIKRYIKNANVHPGLAYIVSTKIAPGVIEQYSGQCRLMFGDRKNPNNSKLKDIEKLFRDADISAEYSDDITRDLWGKFIFICAYSGMTAVCRVTIGKVLEDTVTLDSYKRCINEAVTVGRKLNVNLPKDTAEKSLVNAQKIDYNSKSSLLVDIENKRRTEIESLNGTLVRIAKKVGVDVPVNKLIYGAIRVS
ncbi:MAG: 2-dehydropantoate 2-reductase [Nanoarchaeota archaeon]